jgi:hypothetical protein
MTAASALCCPTCSICSNMCAFSVLTQQALCMHPRMHPITSEARKLGRALTPRAVVGCCTCCRFIADGVIPHDAFCSIYSSRQKLSSSGSSRSSSPAQHSSTSSQDGGDHHTNSNRSSNQTTGYFEPQLTATVASLSDAPKGAANSYRRYRLNTTPTGTRDNSRHGSSSSSSGAGAMDGADHHHVRSSTPTAAGAAAAAASDAVAAAPAGGWEGVPDACGLEVPPPQRERFVFFRGVHWAAPEVNSVGAALLGVHDVHGM